MLNNDYRRGYNAGYKMGVKSGLEGSSAKVLMEHDLIYIYGVLCLTLKRKRKWKPETIQSLVEDIQNTWDNLDTEFEPKTMSELVLDETGIPLFQVAENILASGKDD